MALQRMSAQPNCCIMNVATDLLQQGCTCIGCNDKCTTHRQATCQGLVSSRKIKGCNASFRHAFRIHKVSSHSLQDLVRSWRGQRSASRERFHILLLYQHLCQCITSPVYRVRGLVQDILLQSGVCLGLYALPAGFDQEQ